MELLHLLHLHHLLLLCVLVTAADGNGADVIKVPEDSDVVLPCSLSSMENLESKLFDWKKDQNMEVFICKAGRTYGNGFTGQHKDFEGRVSHFPDELKKGNASIKITKTKVSDSGTYTCIFPDDDSSGSIRQEFSVQLVVGACPKPSVKRVQVTDEEQALLRCVVQRPFHPSKVEWWDGSGNILQAQEVKPGGSQEPVLETTVNKTGTYSCVVTQEQICHRVQEDTYVSIHGPAPEPHVSGPPVGWIVAAVSLAVVVLALVVFGVIGYRKLQNQIQSLKGSPGENEPL